MDGPCLYKKTTNQAAEMNKVLHELDKNNPENMKSTLNRLSKLVSVSKKSSTYFYRLGGIKKVLKFMEKNKKEVDIIALSVLASCTLNDKRCQAELAANEKVFDILSKVLEEAEHSTYKLATFAMILLSGVVTKSGISQSLARESKCLYHLVVLFLRMLQALTVENMTNVNQNDNFTMWETLCVTIKKCVNDPRNETNQHQVNTIISKSIQFLEGWFQSGNYSCVAKYVEALIAMLIHVVSCNVMNQTNIATYSGMNTIISGLTILDDWEMPIDSNSNNIQEKLVQLLDATISDNSKNCTAVSAMGAIPILLQLLLKFKNKQKLSVLVTLTHLLEIREESRKEFIEMNGISSLVLATLNMKGHPEVGQAATCLIKYCAANLPTSSANIMEDSQNSQIHLTLDNWIPSITNHSQKNDDDGISLPLFDASVNANCQDTSAARKESKTCTETSNFISNSKDQSLPNNAEKVQTLSETEDISAVGSIVRNVTVTVNDDDIFVKPKLPSRYNTGEDYKSGNRPNTNSGLHDGYYREQPNTFNNLRNEKHDHLSSRQATTSSVSLTEDQYNRIGTCTAYRVSEYAASEAGNTEDYALTDKEVCFKQYFGSKATHEEHPDHMSQRSLNYVDSDTSYRPTGCDSFRNGVIHADSKASYTEDRENNRSETRYEKNYETTDKYVGYEESTEAFNRHHEYAQRDEGYNRDRENVCHRISHGYSGSIVGSRVGLEYAPSNTKNKRDREYARSNACSRAGSEYAPSEMKNKRGREYALNSACSRAGSEYAQSDMKNKRGREYALNSACSRAGSEYAQSDMKNKRGRENAQSNACSRAGSEYAQCDMKNKRDREYARSNAGSRAGSEYAQYDMNYKRVRQWAQSNMRNNGDDSDHAESYTYSERHQESAGNSGVSRDREYVRSRINSTLGHKYKQVDIDSKGGHTYAQSDIGNKTGIEYVPSIAHSREGHDYVQSRVGNKGNHGYAGSAISLKTGSVYASNKAHFQEGSEYARSSLGSRAASKYAQSDIENRGIHKRDPTVRSIYAASDAHKAGRANVKTRKRHGSMRGSVQLSERDASSVSSRRRAEKKGTDEISSRMSAGHASKAESHEPPRKSRSKIDVIKGEAIKFSTREVKNLQEGVTKFGMDFKKICNSYVFNSKTSHDLYKKWTNRFVQHFESKSTGM